MGSGIPGNNSFTDTDVIPARSTALILRLSGAIPYCVALGCIGFKVVFDICTLLLFLIHTKGWPPKTPYPNRSRTPAKHILLLSSRQCPIRSGYFHTIEFRPACQG